MKHIHRIVCITTALTITLAFITAPMADDSTQKIKELFSRGFEAIKAQKYDEAIKYFEDVLEINPDNSEAHNNLGVAYAGLGRYSEAVEAYKQVIHIKPDYAEAHYSLGQTYSRLKRYAEAAEAFKQVIRINPNFPDAHYGLGFAYTNLKR